MQKLKDLKKKRLYPKQLHQLCSRILLLYSQVIHTSKSAAKFANNKKNGSVKLYLSKFWLMDPMFLFGPPWKPRSIDIVKDLIGLRLCTENVT